MQIDSSATAVRRPTDNHIMGGWRAGPVGCVLFTRLSQPPLTRPARYCAKPCGLYQSASIPFGVGVIFAGRARAGVYRISHGPTHKSRNCKN